MLFIKFHFELTIFHAKRHPRYYIGTLIFNSSQECQILI